MTICHHPSEDLLAAHATGALKPAFEFVVAAHLDACALCRREMALLCSTAGGLLEDVAPAPLSDAALDRALAQLGAVALEPKAAALPAQELWLAPGIHMRRLWRDGANKARAYYLRVGAGRALPHHGHDGAEMTCVLSGAFWDGGVRYGAGDFVEASAAHSHQPRVDESGECICLIGSDSPPRGHGLAELVMRLRM